MPKIDRRIIIGYSNLSFLISVNYFFDIAKIKKDETKIKDFMNVEKLSTTMLSLNIFVVSKLLLKMINRSKKITRLDSL